MPDRDSADFVVVLASEGMLFGWLPNLATICSRVQGDRTLDSIVLENGESDETFCVSVKS